MRYRYMIHHSARADRMSKSGCSFANYRLSSCPRFKRPQLLGALPEQIDIQATSCVVSVSRQLVVV